MLAFLRNQRARATAICFAIAPIPLLAASACSSSSGDDSSVVAGDSGAGSLRDGSYASDALASSCVPGDVSTFTGGDYHPPVGAHQGLCDDDTLAAYVDCKQNANPVSCSLFTSGDGAKCLACIETKESAPNWGPIVTDASDTHGTLNFPGCLALAFGEGQSTTGCAATTQKSENCQDVACSANCASSTGATSPADLAQCENSALLGGCKSFADAASLACTEDAGGADAVCYRQTYEDGGASEDEFAYIARVTKYFCGSSDSITDAGAASDGGG